AEAATLAEVVASLPDGVAVREPRPALRERLLAAARAEARGTEQTRRGWGLRSGSGLGRVRVWPMVMAGLASAVIVLAAADLSVYGQLNALTAERDNYSLVVQSLRQGGRVWY